MIVQVLKRTVIDRTFLSPGDQYTGSKKILQPYIDLGLVSEVKVSTGAADTATGDKK
nr:MAG TPA: hypothetical protein [Bacteriophage sp.]